MYYGEGDFLKSLNIAYQASDYSDADYSAANVATILAVMYGIDVIPENFCRPIKNRIKRD